LKKTPDARGEEGGDEDAVTRFGLSERRACQLVRLHRSSYRYQARPPDDDALRERMRELARKHRRFGSPRLHALLRREALVVNHKRTERIYRQEGLALRRKRRRRRISFLRMEMPAATRPHEVWSMDFLSDACAGGRRLRILTIVDDFTRLSPGILVGTSISGRRVAAFIDRLALFHGYPQRLRVDNGPEFTSAFFHQWAAEKGIQLEHIRPGKPSDNAFIESFNGKLRDECLNEHWFAHVRDAQEKIESWRQLYNEVRPHSSLNDRTPYEFFKEQQMTLQEEKLHLPVTQRTG